MTKETNTELIISTLDKLNPNQSFGSLISALMIINTVH